MRKNNQGFSLIELIVVIAIMAVMIGVTGFSLAFLFGADARQAAAKIGAQLNETKTGSMSRYDESMTLAYRTKDTAKGIPSDGYYAENRTWTIENTDQLVKEDEDTIFREVGSSRVNITIYYDGGKSLVLGDTHSVTISYNRTSGAMDKTVIDGSTVAPVTLESMVVSSASKEYTITFIPETGKHMIR